MIGDSLFGIRDARPGSSRREVRTVGVELARPSGSVLGWGGQRPASADMSKQGHSAFIPMGQSLAIFLNRELSRPEARSRSLRCPERSRMGRSARPKRRDLK